MTDSRSPQKKEHTDDPHQIEALHDFVEFMRKLLGDVAPGRMGVNFGGTLYYAYQRPTDEEAAKATDCLLRKHFTEEEIALIIELLPQARDSYQKQVTKRIRRALDDLALESLDPIYQALGRHHTHWEGDRWQRASKTVEVTVEDGFIRRKRAGKDLPFVQAEEWPVERLKAALRDVENFFLTPSTVTLPHIADIINKTWAPGSNLSGASLQKLLERKGIKWRERKKQMIAKIKIRHEEHIEQLVSDKSH